MKSQSNDDRLFKVLNIRHLTDTSYILTIERRDTKFIAGQHLALALPTSPESREYSIYSGENDPYVELLIKEVHDGLMSKKFKKLKAGDHVYMYQPVGYFTLPQQAIQSGREMIFVASGTGISPFHSYVRTYNGLNYKLLHGVRQIDEAYERDHYDPARLVVCTSRDKKGDFNGRVTDYLRQSMANTDALYYLCGNYNMIDDVYSILEKKGVPTESIKAEVYF